MEEEVNSEVDIVSGLFVCAFICIIVAVIAVAQTLPNWIKDAREA